MTEAQLTEVPVRPPGVPGFVTSFARAWLRLSPRLVPILAVLTAFLAGIPLMIIAGGDGDVARGLRTTGNAYSALIEGITGLTINDVATEDDFAAIRQYSQNNAIEATRLTRQARPFERVMELGPENLQVYRSFLSQYPLDAEQISDWAERLPEILAIGPERLREMGPTLAVLGELERAQVSELAANVAGKTILTAEELTAAAALWPALAEMDESQLTAALDTLTAVNEYGIVALQRHHEALTAMEAMGLDPTSADTQTLIAIAQADPEDVLDGVETLQRIEDNAVADPVALGENFRLVSTLYERGYLTTPSVNDALETELDDALANHLIIRRPGNRALFADEAGNNVVGGLRDDQGFPAVYLRLGNSVLLFFPGNLETTIVRAIPFVITGLAVALGFKAGVFNIGAEGQIYAGAVLAVWVGISPLFSGLPLFIHLPLAVAMGLLGGALWGAVPGALKAYTGAHEVITTIMLNFIAIRLVDWLIQSDDPVILGDPSFTAPQTPYVFESARLPPLNQLPTELYVAVLVLVALAIFAWQFWPRRGQVTRQALTRPILASLLAIAVVIFMRAITVRGNLHAGLLLMFIAIWVTDWFLERTTLGFEIRTVGTNPNAARYAGMSVARNIVLALTLSGALAGLAGMIQVTGVQYYMQPGFISGAGFDAIAVALLARQNPRNMLWAGLLWGGLLNGAGLMQLRADISVDLVLIIQALIVMFIAADQIIRFVWRVPVRRKEDEVVFSTGWGG